MNNRILSEKEIVDALIDRFHTMEFLRQKDIEYHKEIIKQQEETIKHNKETMREKWRKTNNKYRETHKEQFNAYMKVKTLEYYHANKEEISKKRAIRYKEKKEEKRLKNLAESLGKS